MRSGALDVLVALSADRMLYQHVLQTGAVQGVLDLIETERLDARSRRDAAGPAPLGKRDTALPPTPSQTGSELERSLQVLDNLARRDPSLLHLFRDHPAVEDLQLSEAWRRYDQPPEDQATAAFEAAAPA